MDFVHNFISYFLKS